jgi:ABC transporter, phosphonate, periplasmic substrate-binding protein
MIVRHPNSDLHSVEDLLGPKGTGRSFAFGDKGSTSGYLIPLQMFLQRGIYPEKHFARVLHTKHQAMQMRRIPRLRPARRCAEVIRRSLDPRRRWRPAPD